MNYPHDKWYEVRDTDGSELWHFRRCGHYRVQRTVTGDYLCWNSVAGDGFGEVEIGRRPGVSSAMAFCREHKDTQEAS